MDIGKCKAEVCYCSKSICFPVLKVMCNVNWKEINSVQTCIRSTWLLYLTSPSTNQSISGNLNPAEGNQVTSGRRIHMKVFKVSDGCGLVIRVLGYRSRSPGSIPDSTRFSET
jgi:hypothetical protein